MKIKRAAFVALCLSAVMILGMIPTYDKKADPFKDLQKAKETASKEKKRIIIFVGGKWCDWCGRLDNFINNDPELSDLLVKNYVIMKVYVETDLTPNGLFLAKYPSAPGFPHIYVLNSNGDLLVSQRTDILEKGESYDNVKVKEFLGKYAPKK